jgi:hypothetical protein
VTLRVSWTGFKLRRMKSVAILVCLYLTACAEMLTGFAQGAAGHPLGPNPQPRQAQSCIVNTQCHAVGIDPCNYVTQYQTCQ